MGVALVQSTQSLHMESGRDKKEREEEKLGSLPAEEGELSWGGVGEG